MKRFLNLATFCFLLFSLSAQKPNIKLVPVAEGWSKNSVNTTVFRSNSLVSYCGKQYIAFYNEQGYVVLGKRDLNSAKWEIRKTPYKGKVQDAHNIISLMVDGKGFLHVSWDHHVDSLHYAKSIAPESLVLGDKISMIGTRESKVTYPGFHLLPNGNILFVYRDGSSGNGTMVFNKYDCNTGCWTRVQDILIDGENLRNAYWQMCLDKKGVIHLSWVWRESGKVESNHDFCYAKSSDEGKTWQKSNGETYQLPINAGNAEYICRIPQKSELINQTSMTCDENGNPYIASYWRTGDSKIPQYRLIYFDGLKWNEQQVSNRMTAFSLSGYGTKKIPISRPRIAIDQKNGKIRAWYIFRDEERGSKVSLAFNPNLKEKKWSYSDLTDFPVDSWEPSYDTSLWDESNKLHLFVQKTGQGDGEKLENIPAQMIYVLELK